MIILLVACPPAFAQGGPATWEDYFVDMVELDEYDETELVEVYEQLWELEAQPLNINTADYEDFCKIPGLDIDQISDIMYYRDKYGALRTMEELAMVKSIGAQMRRFMGFFFVAKPAEPVEWYRRPRLDSIMRHGSGTVMVNTSIPLYDRAGDDGKYLGDKFKYGIKLKGKFSKNLKYGLVGAKDGGEPFFCRGNGEGFDHYSFFVNVNNVGRLKSVMLGRYRMKLGQGLILNNGFALGKQFMLTAVGAESSMTGHASRSDGHYLQGAAATIGLLPERMESKLELTGFWSYRKIDASLNKDGTVSSIVTSGYHRSESEMAKKNNTSEMMTGGRLGWRRERWRVGVSGVYTWYDRPLNPSETQEYKLYYPRGYDFWNASVDYAYLSRRLTFAGETATGGCGALATVNTLALLLPKEVRVTAVQRFYSYKYNAILANAFNDGGRVQNESGVYVGVKWPVVRHLTIDAYTDYAYHPWAKYRIDGSSYSWDNSMNLTYERGKWTSQARYRLRLRQRNNADKTAIVGRREHSARVSTMRAWDVWTVKAQADGRLTEFEGKVASGCMLSLAATVKPGSIVSASALMGYFHTDDYDNRVYIYERGMLESMSFGSFYGQGMRLSAVVRADINRSWMVMLKAGFTQYFDRETISSGDREIMHSAKTDLDLQVRYRF